MLLPIEKKNPPKQKLENTSYTAIIWFASNEPKTCTKLKNDCILSNFMKSWLNKVPLFFWYHAYLTLFWVHHFVPLPNLQINLSLKDLVLRIWKLPKIIHPTTQETESRRKSHVPGLKTWRFKNWYVPCPNHPSYRLGSFTQLEFYGWSTRKRIFTFLDCQETYAGKGWNFLKIQEIWIGETAI